MGIMKKLIGDERGMILVLSLLILALLMGAGVGAILLPDRHMLFPTAYFEQTKEIFEALDLYLGAGLLGLVEKTTTSN